MDRPEDLPIRNPFRPSAGHPPPHLAGRHEEVEDFKKMLLRPAVYENLLVTGLRGVGKTVLLDRYQPEAIASNWWWVSSVVSESSSLSETRLTSRILLDLSVVTADVEAPGLVTGRVGYRPDPPRLGFETLAQLYEASPGLAEDRLKSILALVWSYLRTSDVRGVVFAYDEAQNLTDHPDKEEFPAAMLLDVFQSIQKQGIPFMLVLAGLPTLFPKLVQARTFAERMFHVQELGPLSDSASREAITVPLRGSPIQFSPESVDLIIHESSGYPYFVQFFCKAVFDGLASGRSGIPIDEITRKLDVDFFAPRWMRATDRQQELLFVIASIETPGGEFAVKDVVARSAESLGKPFSASHVAQMLSALMEKGLVYKRRHGKYVLAVPLLGRFIRRQRDSNGGP